jgi:hypothetical protein
VGAVTPADLASWWWHVAKVTARGFWDGLPGPWPVKAVIIVALAGLFAAGQLIPGEVDEYLLAAALARLNRWYQARR